MTNIPRRSLAAGVGLLFGAMAIPARSQQLAISATTLRLTPKPLTFNPEIGRASCRERVTSPV